MPETHTTSTLRSRLWQGFKWALPFFAVFLPIVFLGTYTLDVASDTVRELVEEENMQAGTNLSQVITQEFSDAARLNMAVASLTGTIIPIEEEDPVLAARRLRSVTLAEPKVHRAFITGTEGGVWVEFPQMLDTREQSYASDEWYTGVRNGQGTYVSHAVQRPVSERQKLVAQTEGTSIEFNPIVVPIASNVRSQSGQMLGYLVFEYHVRQFAKLLENVQISGGGHVYILDQQGTVIAHPHLDQSQLTKQYALLDPVLAALDGTSQTIEYTDPLTSEQMLATFLPVSVGVNRWVIVAQQPVSTAYAILNLLKLNIGVASAILSLFTLIMVFVLARLSSKNIRLNVELTDKNQKLRKTAAIVRSSNDAILGLSPEGEILEWNLGAVEMYGYIPQEAIGKSVDVLVVESAMEDSEKVRKLESDLPAGEAGKEVGVGVTVGVEEKDTNEESKESEESKDKTSELVNQETSELNHQFSHLVTDVAEGKEIKQEEMLHTRKDGSQFYVSVTLSRIADDNGETAGISATIRDITERKEVEQMKNDFISFVSHQLKAPVTAIKWMVEGMLDGDDGDVSEQQQETLKKMQDVNTSNYQLITDILNASRIDRGVVAVEPVSMPLRDVVERAVRDYRESCERHDLYLKIEEPDGEIMVDVDIEKAAEAISNSVSNAIKYTEHGGITITLTKEDPFGKVAVADTGKGMNEEMLSKLFTRDQVIGGGASPEKSAGLGLYIGKNFMNLQGGDMWAEAEIGKGSTFFYTLPLSTHSE